MSIPADDLRLLNQCRHYDPHGLYGWHDGTVHTRRPGAERVELVTAEDVVPMRNIGDDIFFAELAENEDYRLRITYPAQPPRDIADGYRFLPTLGSLDLHLISEGRHERLWDVLGANLKTYASELGEITGTAFAVWAPNAEGVSVVGDFCGWNAAQYPMRSLGSTGIWEVFIPGVGAGERYKFAIQTKEGHRIDKADPMARRTLAPPETASVIEESTYEWKDADWLDSRSTDLNVPMSVYEVHVGSWKQGSNYNTLREELIPYLQEHGYTHVELMPVAEHPFGGSWGYQVSSYYAPSARWGNPDDLRALIDALHNAGIGVIVDWVPAHFPKDSFSLGKFDGQACYEHPDPRRGEQSDWGTYVFDFGRNEVRNFLVANALYWAEQFHIDGLRVDAVASMLYLDYSREDWLPNIHGGRENLEAVQFLQETNATVHRHHPGVLTIAEESTSWPGVTTPTEHGGLGFDLKWNMGWMNDTLEYFGHDPIHRSYHHNELTFSMVYAYSERYMLPFSHDEVVHGKGTLWTRMPGDDWNKAAGVRSLFGYMFSHPGKKLMFMGCEFGQTTEWSEAYSIDWSNLEGWGAEYHHGIKRLVRDLNLTYKAHPALWSQDFTQDGFQWVKADDANNSILGYIRYGSDGSTVLAVCNFSGSSQPHYAVWVPEDGTWELILNTDDKAYEGAGNELAGQVSSSDNNVQLHIPANSVQWYTLRR
ncbi:MAG: 1,4-alpha-glucan branching protein GlgB [Corynebacterium casei]|uniref:1,4-alpha-glucan branching protein GlgB n=1 Tax=Corynebacterium casei TaxID=160386 RepID=UPI0026487446|nr:1,4-alpha-glucan branching protein GlgB [Corynebacterium casei]MDN5728030.1 1,4-alpha-glucan branching protein GlgB [Corynebacterium casei]MDN5902979.1 1,4-alpha-glucan branching protein GlgB [Corynebacterium casei]MDN6155501.1 1,4-alpha-glucan branching protein GlgB [Corynebacterium casei]MDN6627683.1 1,4-alpha-glucan branching protein GlgB [Corynebacterium casei]MDN6673101.1 1,4-alpha-glucan branching protein GlgB [Corynebacterium casei]